MRTLLPSALGLLCAALVLTGCGTPTIAIDAGCAFHQAHDELTRPSRSDTPDTIDNLIIYREGMEASCP